MKSERRIDETLRTHVSGSGSCVARDLRYLALILLALVLGNRLSWLGLGLGLSSKLSKKIYVIFQGRNLPHLFSRYCKPIALLLSDFM